MLFQFHSGSIKRCACDDARAGSRVGFNSIVVRLKALQNLLVTGARAAFQFHSGSIKSQFRAFHCANIQTFQFHSGSIKRIGTPRSSGWKSSFNSIVVRLKGGRDLRDLLLGAVSIP